MFGETQFDVTQSDRYKFIDRQANSKEGHSLVLLHGMFGGLSNFDPLLERLDNQNIFVPEIPIYGFDKDDLTIPKLATWLNQVLTENGMDKSILLGNSMGGHIALQYALDYPNRTEALVLTGSSGLFENDLGSSRPKRYDRDYVKERASLTFYDDLVNDTIIDEILDVLQSPAKLGRLLRIARSTHQYNLEDELEMIEQPVLLVWGKNDIITPPQVAETFFEKLPNAVLRWIDRCGHAPMMEHPDQFVEYLNEFLESEYISNNKAETEEHHEGDYTHY